jgi:uncharacterized protein YjbJ (UPF0337 family)
MKGAVPVAFEVNVAFKAGPWRSDRPAVSWSDARGKGGAQMGNEQQNEGRMEQVRGDIKDKVGEATHNERMEREGEYDKAKGTVREGIGDVREGIDNATDDANRAANDWQRDR